MWVLWDIGLASEVALLIVFIVVVATTLLGDRRSARSATTRPGQEPRQSGPHPA